MKNLRRLGLGLCRERLLLECEQRGLRGNEAAWTQKVEAGSAQKCRGDHTNDGRLLPRERGGRKQHLCREEQEAGVITLTVFGGYPSQKKLGVFPFVLPFGADFASKIVEPERSVSRGMRSALLFSHGSIRSRVLGRAGAADGARSRQGGRAALKGGAAPEICASLICFGAKMATGAFDVASPRAKKLC